MKIYFDDDSVSVRLSPDEAVRLGVAIEAGCQTVSRAEYYIRTGLAQPVVREIADVLTSRSRPATSATIELDDGVEEIENPRQPRRPK